MSIKAENMARLLEYIYIKEIVTTDELINVLGVSRATICRYITELDSKGIIKKTYGGAMSSNRALQYEPMQGEKESICKFEKSEIAKAALNIVRSHSSFILDSGSTTLSLARSIANLGNVAHKLFVTNDIKNAYTLAQVDNIELITLGGKKRNAVYSVIGPETVRALQYINTDIYFMGADAVDSKRGVTNANFDEVLIKQEMVKASRQTVLLADHSKFHQKKLAKICDLSDIDVVITDSKTDEKILTELRQYVPCVIVAEFSSQQSVSFTK